MGRNLGAAIAAGIATMLIGGTGHANAQASAAVTLGEITFNHDPAAWRIEAVEAGLVATCLQEDCLGAVIDISRRDGDDGCTKAAMAAEAERLFPAIGRAYVNMLDAGRFALLLAMRHAGPELSSPAFAHACVPWQGSEYRFAMRPETVGATQSWIGGALHYLVAQATAPDAALQPVRIGDVTFSVSTEHWTVSQTVTGQSARLTCRMPACREPGIVAELSVQAPQAQCQSADVGTFDEAYTKVATLPAAGPRGLDFTVSEHWLGCRNYVPPQIEACAVHDGRSYHLTTGKPSGCRGSIWGIPEHVLDDVLQSARVDR